MNESFGELLRGHRVSVGLTQEALAERAALSGQAVGALERGDRRFPRRDTVTRLADALGLSGEPRVVFAAAASRRGMPGAGGPPGDSDDLRGRVWRRALPCDVADFTGRRAELEACEDWLSGPATYAPWVVVVNGMAGCGKSALAVHAAHRFADRFPDGQFFVDLHGFTPGHKPVPAHAALGELLRSLGIPGAKQPMGVERRSALWRSELVNLRTLIVLDNALDAGQVRPLLPGSLGHLVLVTSRCRMADLDGAVELPLASMSESDAAELLSRVAQRRMADRRAVAEVVELCGGLPLAIRLTGTRLRHRQGWTVAGLAERLRDQQRRLGELVAGSRSVAGAFELSCRQLTERQQRVFRLLGLLAGPTVDSYAVAALCGLAVADARRCLEHLVDVHLLREQGTDRYTFHDLLRAYAGVVAHEQEREADRRAALARLVDYYLCAAFRANRMADPFRCLDPAEVDHPAVELPEFPGPHEVMAWWETERPNLLRAIDAAVLAGRDVQAWQLAKALVSFFSGTGNARDQHDTQRVALAAARRVGDRVAEANVLVDLGAACHRLGRLSQARAHLETAATLAGEVDDAHAEAWALNRLALLDQSDGDYAQAETRLHHALTLFRSVGDRRQEGGTLACLATLYEQTGRCTESLRTFDDALAIMEPLGPLVYLGRVHEGLAWLHSKLGQPAAARAAFEHALHLAREVSDREGEVRAVLGLGEVHSRCGQLDDALGYYHQVLEAEENGMWLGNTKARVLRSIAFIHARRGRHAEAVDLRRQALSIAENHGARVLRISILNDLADGRAATRHSDAGDYYRQALALAHDLFAERSGGIRLREEVTRAHEGLALG